MKKVWENIWGYEGHYQISNFGDVKSLARIVHGKRPRKQKEKLLKKTLVDGYPQVRLYKNKKSEDWKIHRLVGLSFVLNKKNKPQINHKDSNRQNNRADNLEWCTNAENQKWSWEHTDRNRANGEKIAQSKLTAKQVLKIKDELLNCNYGDIIKIAKKYVVSIPTIKAIKANKTWKHVN